MIDISKSLFLKIVSPFILFFVIYLSSLWSSWDLYTIDNSFFGADGVRVIERNGSVINLLSVWEESGLTCLYSPKKNLNLKWNRVIVGKTPNVEDAIFIDDNKGHNCMIMSFCEGEERKILLHVKDTISTKWMQEVVSTPLANERWMTGENELIVENKSYIIAGGKDKSKIYAFEKTNAHKSDTIWFNLSEVSWTMNIIIEDFDGDGDDDVFFTDRNGMNRGCWWLENSNNLSSSVKWNKHRIGSEQTMEYMFADISDVNGDGLKDIVVVTNDSAYSTYKIWQSASIRLYLKKDGTGKHWDQKIVRFPAFTGSAKGIRCGDINNDGMVDIVVSCENAFKGRVGIFAILNKNMKFKEVKYLSGPRGTKFDQIQLVDLDSDGDIEIVTTEEWNNLGLIYYKNPFIDN
jgi:hypothetical protein